MGRIGACFLAEADLSQAIALAHERERSVLLESSEVFPIDVRTRESVESESSSKRTMGRENRYGEGPGFKAEEWT